MHSDVRLDRRIQAGAANITLAVRSGEASWAELGGRLAGFAADRFVLLTDGTASAGHLARVRGLAAAQAPSTVHDLRDGPLPGGSAPTGRTVLIAVGGERACGVEADVRVPTDLATACGPALAAHRPDPAGDGGGSLAGSAPALVWVRADLLAARPAPETRAGMVAVIRHVLAVCPAQYGPLAAVLDPGARYGEQAVTALLAICADARAALVCFDPYETGPALALGYGRSLGRALRTVAGPALAPGDAEALGLLLAARVAFLLGLSDGAAAWSHHELLARNGSPTALPAGVDPDRLADAVTGAADPGLLLLAELGHPYCADGRLLSPVGGAVLRAAARSLGVRAALPHSRAAAPDARPAEDQLPVPAALCSAA
ncbi:3-dehydroquinate synthase family protein [Kitasatospora sp. NBC_00458]|uniref:3-dehydroquinate synthase family protein n=1 Tax=Kitasatospora sp. NBC_00458 TaxID=2903568 RepID=UPI002E18A07A